MTWASAAAVLAPAVAPAPERAVATYTVAHGELGVTEASPATVVFRDSRAVAAAAGGTVTSVTDGVDEDIERDERLMTLDLRPVVAGVGAVPAFRDVARGSSGDDVAQLRAHLGLDAGTAFDAQTERAVRGWQQRQGFPIDGVVRSGDIVYFPSLPSRIRLADGLEVGSVLAPGEPMLAILESRPEVEIVADNASRFSAGMVARLALPSTELVVEGALEGPYEGDDGIRRFRLVDAQGVSACGDECADAVPATATSQLTAQVETVPRAEGLIVPDAALVSRADGTLALRDVSQALIPVEVVVSGEGLSIVEGVEPGTIIELFGGDEAGS